jgi:DNA-binding NtrC family response regulator
MILLVDDDDGVRYALARILRNSGYEVMEAADGTEASALLHKSHFDLVISDIRMPSESGLVLAAHIYVKWRDTPVILISGHLSEEAGKYIAQGFAEFIHKPVDATVLIPTVQRLLSSKAQTVAPSSTPKLYRRKQQSEVWHFSSDCTQWPGENYVEHQQVPSAGEMCNECIVTWRTASH